ncbi:hypothetical protein MW887_001924 [Aspergillus wentii]|nr:hypothetical protein MW887_001924 [Aspergillus wentii]
MSTGTDRQGRPAEMDVLPPNQPSALYEDSFGSKYPTAQRFCHEAKKAWGSCFPHLFWVLPTLGVAAGLLQLNSLFVFVLNLVAVIPLSAMISSSCDELGDHLGDLIGELLSATFGNVVELTAGVLGLINADESFSQSVMIGSVLSDALFVFGTCIIAASYNKKVLFFNKAAAQALSSLMIITAITIILPTTLYSTFPVLDLGDKIESFSRGTSIILLVLYIGYLYFHLVTHKHLFQSQSQQNNDSDSDNDADSNNADNHPSGPFSPEIFLKPALHIAFAVTGTIVCTYLMYIHIPGTMQITSFSKTFIALILVPIASNSTEAAEVLAAARNGDVDATIGMIVDSILQISLFAIPFLVMLGWAIRQPMTLYFETSHTVIFFFSIMYIVVVTTFYMD